jgi:polygalacturonase
MPHADQQILAVPTRRRFHTQAAIAILAVFAIFAILLALAPQAVRAQDTRNVVEPHIPSACIVLRAHLTAQGDTLAASDESRPDTAAIQHALDHCTLGHAVELKSDASHDAFLSGPLELRAGVTLLIDQGVTLFASRNPRDYDVIPGKCGTITEQPHGCKPMLSGTGVANAAIMGDGVIDGRGGMKILGPDAKDGDLSWWNLAEKARAHFLQNNPRMIVLTDCDNFILYRIHLRNSPNFHVSYSGGNGFTVWGITISVPGNARNADGIDIGQPFPIATRPTTNVTVTHSFIHAGDDIVAAKSPYGLLTSHITVAHNHFYTGHGMSIGSATSGGITAMRVSDLTIDGPDNAFHIKSNTKLGGPVHDIEFSDICVRNSRNPIDIETHYDSTGHEVDGTTPDKLPHFTDIRFNNVSIAGGGKITLDGLDAAHPIAITLHNVVLDQPQIYKYVEDNAILHLDGSNLPVSGENVTSTNTQAAASTAPNNCAVRFVPFPDPISPR